VKGQRPRRRRQGGGSGAGGGDNGAHNQFSPTPVYL